VKWSAACLRLYEQGLVNVKGKTMVVSVHAEIAKCQSVPSTCRFFYCLITNPHQGEVILACVWENNRPVAPIVGTHVNASPLGYFADFISSTSARLRMPPRSPPDDRVESVVADRGSFKSSSKVQVTVVDAPPPGVSQCFQCTLQLIAIVHLHQHIQIEGF
jgi:hypothetical protein